MAKLCLEKKRNFAKEAERNFFLQEFSEENLEENVCFE
jgi:hypothetical protein